jgi:outer membrane protein
MKKVIKSIFFTLFAAVAVAQAQPVQKIGYLNAQAILADMTDMKGADSQLEAYAKQLSAKDSMKVVAFEAKARAVAEKQQKGELAPVQLENEKKKLEAEQAEIQKFEQDMQQDLAKKRQELYQPVLDKVNKAISDVAKEQGFTYVIDVTAGTLLYADEKNDLQALVRKKLGLPDAPAAVTKN